MSGEYATRDSGRFLYIVISGHSGIRKRAVWPAPSASCIARQGTTWSGVDLHSETGGSMGLALCVLPGATTSQMQGAQPLLLLRGWQKRRKIKVDSVVVVQRENDAGH